MEESGDRVGAISEYRRAAETDPTCSEAWHDLGLAAEAAEIAIRRDTP